MSTLMIDLPAASLSEEQAASEDFRKELKLSAAIYWYQRSQVSMAMAAKMAGLSLRDFLKTLAERKLDVLVLDIDDLKREMACG